jgi:hypothetical protein
MTSHTTIAPSTEAKASNRITASLVITSSQSACRVHITEQH